MRFYELFRKNINEATYNGSEVTLNKPMYNNDGDNKKFKVYVTDPKDNETVKVVKFGSDDMEIKRDDPERRKSFRARHGCDEYSFDDDRDKAGYWSCRMWREDKTVSELVSEDDDNETDIQEDEDFEDPCWDGYEMYGFKTDENGERVPNCVPKEN